ncbi:acyl-CoA ligase (AMP-forming), exosortase A system-associated [Nonomuraea sp. NPDC050022]|uniref:acyl-CoA ligase (AMP-forming), exosortase A system-associated n=1 Tax=Nonomuraea sp. NPDC050022 TaxID=3364358 RepID=UPI0037A44123
MLTRVDDVVRCGDPDRPAVTYQEETLSYGELAHRVGRAASGLRRLGLRRGERVVVYLEKRIETVVAMLAVSAAGGVFVPVNPLFKPQQVGYVAADCGAVAVVTSVERHRLVGARLQEVESLRHLILIGDRPRVPEPRPITTWSQLCASDDEVPAPERAGAAEEGPAPEEAIDADVAAILYTSGSTGNPKGVVLSHRNLLAGARSVAHYLGHTRDDVVLGVLPLSFDTGFSQLTTSFIAGAHVVLMNYLVPGAVVRLCARHGVTGLTCVPPLWLQLAAQTWPEAATRRLRYFANTGGRLPKPALDSLRATFPQARPYLMYGLTEAFRSTYLDPEQVDRRPDSIGKAIPNAEILVVRPDGAVCEPGEKGEIVHRGALVALGYWNDPERTAERFRPYPPGGSPWGSELAVWSGDVAYRDDEGFIYFVGRTDEMIKTSGYRVSPSEIEEAAYATGLVGEAVAFGVADDTLGQQVVLVVSGPSGASCDTETLVKALERDLPRYMVPRRVVVRDRLPRSGNGKFDRTELRRSVTW